MTAARSRSPSLVSVAALLATAMLSTLGCNLADTVVLWPPGGAARATGGVRHVVSSEGKDVEIWATPAGNGEPAAYVLEFYGNADRADFHVGEETLRSPDVELWGVNYPGYGGSRGPATLHGVAAAAVAAFDALAAEAHGRPILAFGESLGTTAALHVAATRDVRGLLLVNPPPLRELIIGHYGWWNLWLLAPFTATQVPAELDSVQNARNCRAPSVFVMAEEDAIVPPPYQQKVIDAYAGPREVIVIPGGTHNGEAPPATKEKIALAVARLVRSAVARARGSR